MAKNVDNSVMERFPECQRLATRFTRKAGEGLVGVKFFVRNPDEAMAESVCREVLRLYEAVDRGEALDFKELRIGPEEEQMDG